MLMNESLEKGHTRVHKIGTEKNTDYWQKRNDTKRGDTMKCKSTTSNFSCVLKGDVLYLKKIKECIKRVRRKRISYPVQSDIRQKGAVHSDRKRMERLSKFKGERG
jgi:hypothetical protein